MTAPDTNDTRDWRGYNPMTETYHHQYDWDAPGTLGQAVISAVAAATGTDSTELEPLYNHVDPDALDALFRPLSTDHPRATGSVSLVVDGYDVTVYSHGEIIVHLSEKNNLGGGRRLKHT
ncbi:HalOD1 output domain-containing protein [Haloarcula sp. Atlit-7R]|uniref:HalOD1 output domain-containing protein n=1 Tax=Haloarcula sp. Atlit-7R TaxID=2282125 RepID=UPI001314FC1F